MGTTIEVWAESEDMFDATVQWLVDFEKVCSRFDAASELSRVNRDPRRRVPVSALLSEAIEAADRARSITGGLVDAGLGAVLQAWGYDRSFSEVRDLETPPVVESDGGWRIEGGLLEREPGTVIDLGGVGKGWACDVAVESGWAKVVSAGGDIRSADPETRVPVLDPWGETAAEVALGVGALATSSTTRRRWSVGAGEAHHVIDPRTLAPAESPILSATVVAETAAQAEAGAKSVLILGTEGLQWAEQQSWIKATMVVWHDGSVFATNGLELAA
jgi:thiamine biosynthesis lipoprotein